MDVPKFKVLVKERSDVHCEMAVIFESPHVEPRCEGFGQVYGLEFGEQLDT